MKFLAKYVILNRSIQFREIQHTLRVISLYNGGRMKKRFLCWLLSAIMLFTNIPLNAYAQDEPYVVTVYNESNGLPTGEANVVMQSSDGYIWIGSYGGLIRYDGTQFRNYSTEGAIESSSVRSIFEDSKGRLWVGTNDAGVYMMENDVFTHITADSKTDFLCVRGFCEGSDGTVLGAMLKDLGCINIADSDAMLLENLSVEYILRSDPDYVFIVQRGDDNECQQIMNQLRKLHNVKKVKLLEVTGAVEREMMLLKVQNTPENRAEIMAAAEIYRAKIIDYTVDTMCVEVTGEPSKLNAFVEVAKPLGIVEMCRTGVIALERGKNVLNN